MTHTETPVTPVEIKPQVTAPKFIADNWTNAIYQLFEKMGEWTFRYPIKEIHRVSDTDRVYRLTPTHTVMIMVRYDEYREQYHIFAEFINVSEEGALEQPLPEPMLSVYRTLGLKINSVSNQLDETSYQKLFGLVFELAVVPDCKTVRREAHQYIKLIYAHGFHNHKTFRVVPQQPLFLRLVNDDFIHAYDYHKITWGNIIELIKRKLSF